MDRILITGGLGFIGSELLRELDTPAHVLDNCLSGYLKTDPHLLIYGDIRDYSLLDRLLPQYDIIVHLAGIVGAPACSIDEKFSNHINVDATRHIAHSLTEKQKFIFISSTSSYGRQSGVVTEETRLAPLTNYGIHKAIGEQYTIMSKADSIILRPATAFGASQKVRVDLLPNTLAYNALTHGIIDLFEPEVVRPFIHVKDFARVLMYAISGSMPWNTVYNIGDPTLTMTKRELSQHIADRCGAELVIRDGFDPDQRNYDVSFDRLLSTGFIFSGNALSRCVDDIRQWLPQIQQNYSTFSSPYNTEQFILKEKEHGLFNQK